MTLVLPCLMKKLVLSMLPCYLDYHLELADSYRILRAASDVQFHTLKVHRALATACKSVAWHTEIAWIPGNTAALRPQKGVV